MSWAIGYDDKWRRDIGYGVPAYCDHPDCHDEIDRGLAHVCGNEKPFGGDEGCGLYFCPHHLVYHEKRGTVCECCADRRKRPFVAKPDHPDWVRWKLADKSWREWRDTHPDEVLAMLASLCHLGAQP